MEYLQFVHPYLDYFHSYFQNYYFVTPVLFIVPVLYYFLAGRDERISRKRIRQLNNDMLRNNAILESLLLTVGKMMQQQTDTSLYLDNLEDKMNKLEETIGNFHHTDYDNFKDYFRKSTTQILGELKILHDATFLPNDGDNDQDSDYEP